MALSFAFAGDVGVSLAIGIALAHNEVANQVTAAIRNAAHQVRATTGGVTLEARETAGIRAISAAAAVAVGAGFYAGIAIAGAGAWADNAIYTKVNAYLDASTVNAATTVSLTATDTATIRAIVAAVSVSVGIGVAGVGVGIGAALASNTIGTAAVADYSSAQTLTGGLANGRTVRIASGPDQGDVYRYVGTALSGTVALAGQAYADTTKWTLVARASGAQAFSRNSTVTATGAMTAGATAGQTIEALTLAGTAVVSAGVVGIGLGGAGASTVNEIAALVTAYVDGGSVTAGRWRSRPPRDTSTITTLTAAVGIAASFAGVAIAAAVAVALARNRIANEVGAYVTRATIATGSGALTATATEAATITATAGRGGAGHRGRRVRGRHQWRRRRRDQRHPHAHTRLLRRRDRHRRGRHAERHRHRDDQGARRHRGGRRGRRAGGVGASIGVSLARNLVGWDPTTGVAATLTSGQVVGSLSAGQRVRIVAGPGAGDVYEFVGAARSGSIDSASSTARRLAVEAGQPRRPRAGSSFDLGRPSPRPATSRSRRATPRRSTRPCSPGRSRSAASASRSAAPGSASLQPDRRQRAGLDGAGTGTLSARRLTLTAEDGSTIAATAGAAAVALALGGGEHLDRDHGPAYNEIATDVRGHGAAVTTTVGAVVRHLVRADRRDRGRGVDRRGHRRPRGRHRRRGRRATTRS